MSSISNIEWTDATWNPARGCTKVSPGCKNCYAKTFAERFRGVPNHAYELGFDPRLVPEKLLEPLGWKSPKMIFVNSMSDLFHEDFPDDYIVDCARVMCMAGWHTYQVLTKRADRMAELLQGKLRFAAEQPHIWWGTSVEDQRYGVPRIEQLRQAPAQVRFLSIEPLLEDIGTIESGGHRVGDLRRRERPRSPADPAELGDCHPRSVPAGRRAVLLQTMGRCPQVDDGPPA